MLDDRELANDFSLEHLHHSSAHLLPRGYSAHIIQDGGALTERNTLLHLLYELDASKVHIIVAILNES